MFATGDKVKVTNQKGIGRKYNGKTGTIHSYEGYFQGSPLYIVHVPRTGKTDAAVLVDASEIEEVRE